MSKLLIGIRWPPHLRYTVGGIVAVPIQPCEGRTNFKYAGYHNYVFPPLFYKININFIGWGSNKKMIVAVGVVLI